MEGKLLFVLLFVASAVASGNYPPGHPRHQPPEYPANSPPDYPTSSPREYPANSPQEYPANLPPDYSTFSPPEYPANSPPEYPDNSPPEYPANSPPEYPFRSPPVCNYRGETYNVGQNFHAGDDCNTCTCRSGGRVSCTKKTCFCYAKGQKYKHILKDKKGLPAMFSLHS
uniref:Uncharacterized protein n=1 Tax=Magallana gigas TaxID=29159 RepID=A0A8W8NYD2_MAGGI